MLKYLNGINNNNMNGLFDDFTTWKNNAIQKLPTPIKNVVNAAGNVAQAGAKVSFVAMRSAFLFLVNNNAIGLAEKVEGCIRRDRAKTKIFWENYGGEFSKLIEAVNNGIRAGQPGRPSKVSGSFGITVEAAILLVTSLLGSLAALIKATKGPDKDVKAIDDLEKKGVDDIKKGATDDTLPPGITPIITLPASALPAAGLKSNLPLIIGGIAVLGLGAFFLMKKK